MRLFFEGGFIVWVIYIIGAVGVSLMIDRFLHYHRAQINSVEFLNGVKNVLKRENIVEAISICDATPGPIPHIVKIAILNRDRGSDRLKEILRETSLSEIPRLESRLNLLPVIAQIAPLLGLLGTVIGLIELFNVVQQQGFFIHPGLFAEKLWKALVSTAAGLGVAIVCYAGHCILTLNLNNIIADMEKTAVEIINILTDQTEKK
ncbi:MAG: MotA/TolQ/ExbB proton channel family protein [Verrucomicrobiia bacterium]|jgi:biopolymer transport protein ExbB